MNSRLSLTIAFVSFILASAQVARLVAQEGAEVEAKLDEIVRALASDDVEAIGRADEQLHALVFDAGRPGNADAARALERAIANRLRTEIPDPAKALLIRQLEVFGEWSAAPALKRILLDATASEDLREAARRALVANDTTMAKGALRDALASTEGVLRIGVIQGLGRKRDPLAVGPLMEIVRDPPDADTRFAALEALAEIGEISCLGVIEEALATATGNELAALRRAFLRLADSLVLNNERGTARRIYHRAMTMGPEMRSAALVGVARAELQSEIPTILASLEDPDAEVRAAALEASRVFRIERMTDALIEKLPSATSELRADLIVVLAAHGNGERGAEITKLLAREVVSGTDDEARRVATDELARRETLDADAIGILLDAAGTDGSSSGAIARILVGIDSAEAGGAILQAIRSARGPRKGALLSIAGERADAGALPLLVESSSDEDPIVRIAAFRALARSRNDEAIAPLLRALETEEGEALEAAAASLRALAAPSKAGTIAQALETAGSDAAAARIAALVRALPDGGDAEAIFLRAARDEREAVRLAGLEGLGRSDGETARTALLGAAREEAPPIRRRAVASLIEHGDRLARRSESDAARLYLEILALSDEAPTSARILRSLGEVGGADAIDPVLARLGRDEVGQAAGRAALRLGERLASSDRDRAVALYRRVLDAEVDERTMIQAARRLGRLGVRTDLASRAGFVVDYLALGPITGEDLVDYEPPFPFPVNVDAAVKIGDRELAWRTHLEGDPLGRVDLAEIFGNGVHGAYLRAIISSPAAQKALFKIGSDDQVVVWLDGKLVHKHREQRGLTVDDDTVEVELRPGENEVLLFVINQGGDWAACLRVTDRDGKPIAVR